MRFPWQGGRHPWLDAAFETANYLVGIESKRFEPFRDTKTYKLSPAYDRDVWGAGMTPYTKLRDKLRLGEVAFTYLDAAQLVKHAFGLVTEARRVEKSPALLYFFSEPSHRGRIAISADALEGHRAEILMFTDLVAGAEVRFAACSYREWLATWTGSMCLHATALIERFQP